jgi:UDP-N-acetylglucosamine 2-epimerase (non-hydrolysing)
MKIAVIFGTRPEIIKLSPVIRALQEKSLPFFVIHSNQHYDANMDEIFLNELQLPEAKYNLKIGSGSHGNMTGRMLIEVEKILKEEKPNLLIVQGDTNTVLAVSLAATKLRIPIAHVEAGLRSYSKIPEETNRVLTDRISDFCFAPTTKQQDILEKEGIEPANIYVVGNTVVDSVIQNLEIAKSKQDPLQKFKLEPKKYFLVTAHREENVDNKTNLEEILKSISEIQKKYDLKCLFPLHPRTKKQIEKFKITPPKNIDFTEPTGYLEMLILMENAKLIVTDSGGIQEEACTLHVPCLTMRESTERPESIEVGGNIIVGTNHDKILAGAEEMLNKTTDWDNPFGDGKSGEKIVEILEKKFQ